MSWGALQAGLGQREVTHAPRQRALLRFSHKGKLQALQEKGRGEGKKPPSHPPAPSEPQPQESCARWDGAFPPAAL